MKSVRPYFIYILVGTGILLIDQLTKYSALVWCPPEGYPFGPFLAFDLMINRGISWGMFSSSSTTQFIMITLAVVAVIGVLLLHIVDRLKYNTSLLGETLVLAGAVSNVIDRIVYHGVIDFIAVTYKLPYIPAFTCNIADISIVLGAIVMLYNFLKQGDAYEH